jgi:protein-S-isoprenylcysteine O-methyltransferase Ste14
MSVALASLVTIVSLATLAQHAWAYRGHFASEVMPPGALLLTLVVLGAAAANLWALWTGPLFVPAMLGGLAVELASICLFWLTIAASRAAGLRLAFDPSLPRSVLRQGPYRVVRHPFYTSYILFWIGWTIATWSVWSLPPLVAMLVIYVLAAQGEEGNFARSPHAAEYDAYRRQAGMFWPRPGQK